MLLEFRFHNYKSFHEEATFSMMAAPKQKGLDYSLFNIKNHGKDIKGLCSSVIYGSNAAGKTTVVGAMDTFRAIVLMVTSVILKISVLRTTLLLSFL